jgi:hypothetical protein
MNARARAAAFARNAGFAAMASMVSASRSCARIALAADADLRGGDITCSSCERRRVGTAAAGRPVEMPVFHESIGARSMLAWWRTSLSLPVLAAGHP